MSASSQKPLIFISYARKDTRQTDRLQRSLLQRELEVWVDRSRLIGGQAWPAGLQHAIESCDLMLVLLSPRAMASEYVRREYLYALSLGKPIIPVLLESVPAFPAELRDVQWVDFTLPHNQGYFDLLLALDARGWHPAAASSVGLDWDLAIARATRHQLPPDWHAYRVLDPRWYRKRALIYGELVVLVVVGYAILAEIVATSPLMQNSAAFPILFALAVLLGFTAVAAVVFALKAVQWRREWIGKGAPELFVATPDGFMMRSLAFPMGVKVRPYPFRSAARVSFRPNRDHHSVTITVEYAGSAMTLRTRVPRRFTDTGAIASQVLADFRRYVAAHGPPAAQASSRARQPARIPADPGS